MLKRTLSDAEWNIAVPNEHMSVCPVGTHSGRFGWKNVNELFDRAIQNVPQDELNAMNR